MGPRPFALQAECTHLCLVGPNPLDSASSAHVAVQNSHGPSRGPAPAPELAKVGIDDRAGRPCADGRLPQCRATCVGSFRRSAAMPPPPSFLLSPLRAAAARRPRLGPGRRHERDTGRGAPARELRDTSNGDQFCRTASSGAAGDGRVTLSGQRPRRRRDGSPRAVRAFRRVAQPRPEIGAIYMLQRASAMHTAVPAGCLSSGVHWAMVVAPSGTIFRPNK